MSAPDDDWEDLPVPLPIIRRDPAPTGMPPMSASGPPEEEDGEFGFDLWQEDEAPAEEWSAEPVETEVSSSWGTDPDSESEPEPDEELPDPEQLLRQMQGYEEEDDLPDPEALLRQMQGYEEEDDLPDPQALLRRMQGYEDEDDLPDPEALLRQMQGYEEEDDLPDPAALLQQMQSYEEEDDLPDPELLLLRMQRYEQEDELPDPQALLLQMQGHQAPDEALLLLRRDSEERVEHEPFLEDEAPDQLPDPSALFLRMRGEAEFPDEEAGESLYLIRDPDPDLALDLVSDFGLDPEPAFAPDPILSPDPRLESFGIVLEPDADEVADEIVDEVAEPPAHPEPRPALNLNPPGVSDEDWDEVFLERSTSTLAPLPDPLHLLAQMKAEEADEEDDLPDPDALFLQMQGRSQAPVAAIEPAEEVEEEQSGGLFSRIKAKFTREKRPEVEQPEPVVGVPLPDPSELFRQMQSEREPSAFVEASFDAAWVETDSDDSDWLEQPRPVASGEELPALPDLDAFRAELEEDERARLDSDLLGDLSGPERFAETVSDMEFRAGTFFAATTGVEASPVISPPRPTPPPSVSGPSEALPAPPLPARAGGWMPPTPPPHEDPEPAMLSRPEPVAPRPPAPSPSFREVEEEERPIAARPAVRKSSSTAIIPSGAETKRIEPRPGIKERIKQFKERRRPLSRHQLSVFTRQLAAMIKAGIPLNRGISFCAESDPESAPMLEDVCQKIETGYSFSGSLKDYPESFDPVYVGLVHAGELSGRLNEMLAKLADILEREIELRKRMISVITYPAMLLSVSILGTLGFIFFVLPQLTPLFMDLGVDLPWPTRVLLSLRTVLLPATVTLVLTALTLWFARHRISAYIRGNPGLERRLAYAPLALPVIGPVYDKIVTARVLYSMATMLEVGVTMNQALARAEGAAGNAYVAFRLSRARADLAEGSSVTECFQINSVFPDTALHLISAGEESARLVEMFNYVARHFDEDVQQAMDSAAGMLEPLIMVVMGAVVGFIVIAAALPTIHLLQNFG